MLVSTVARTLVLIGMTVQVASVIRPTLLGKIPFRSPGFINLIGETSSSGQKYNLVISSSQPYNQVGLVKDIGSLLNSINTISPDVINTGLLAPNLISGVPDSALGASEPYIVIPSGFLDPDRRDGTITLQPLRDGAETVLTQPNQEWFYSKVQWVDMNKDGFLDVVTCRARADRDYSGGGGYNYQPGYHDGQNSGGEYNGGGDGYDQAGGSYRSGLGYDPAAGGSIPIAQFDGVDSNGGYIQTGGGNGYDPYGGVNGGGGGYDPYGGVNGGGGGYDPYGSVNVEGDGYDPHGGAYGGGGGYDPHGGVNGDGLGQDLQAAESHSRSFGEIDGELIYLTNPQSGRLTNQWAEMFIGNGPDMFFTHTSVQVALALKEVIITADFYNAKLQVFWTESLTDDWSDQTLHRNREISISGIGLPYYVEVKDVNMDGNPDIVVALNDGADGSLYVYEFPSDFRNGENFVSHRIASGFSEVKGSDKAGAPGAFDFLPAGDPSHKPSIVLAGDDGFNVNIVEPINPSDPNNWQYATTEILSTPISAIKNVKVADVDQDGRYEIFAAADQEGQVYVWTV